MQNFTALGLQDTEDCQQKWSHFGHLINVKLQLFSATFLLYNTENVFLAGRFHRTGSRAADGRCTDRWTMICTAAVVCCGCECDRDAIWTSPASTALRPGPSGSLTSSVGKIGSDDDQSLNDYASLTPGKFTEDGSFIGEYNPAMKYKASRAPPSYNQSQA